MTNREVLDILINAKICRNSNHEKQLNEAIEILQELVDKATPKKAIKKALRHRDGEINHCPNCKGLLTWQNQYCNKCGQKLDWSEDERNQKFEEQ